MTAYPENKTKQNKASFCLLWEEKKKEWSGHVLLLQAFGPSIGKFLQEESHLCAPITSELLLPTHEKFCGPQENEQNSS